MISLISHESGEGEQWGWYHLPRFSSIFTLYVYVCMCIHWSEMSLMFWQICWKKCQKLLTWLGMVTYHIMCENGDWRGNNMIVLSWRDRIQLFRRSDEEATSSRIPRSWAANSTRYCWPISCSSECISFQEQYMPCGWHLILQLSGSAQCWQHVVHECAAVELFVNDDSKSCKLRQCHWDSPEVDAAQHLWVRNWRGLKRPDHGQWWSRVQLAPSNHPPRGSVDRISL